ncbi:MAG: glycosyltransferase family 4 protein [bacterium]
MKIGIVSYWFNRGQGTIGRYIRSIFDENGYETFVLARPTKNNFYLPEFIEKNDVWNQSNVTHASVYNIPLEEYISWVKNNNIDIVFCDQNYQFKEIEKIKRLGIKTIGRFVWESFGQKHVESAKQAFDIIYSLTRSEQKRYAEWGIDSAWIPWGCHPELISVPTERKKDLVYFFYPAGYLSKRKPTGAVIEAFKRVKSPNLRLILKAQRLLQKNDLIRPSNQADLKRPRQFYSNNIDKLVDLDDLDKRIMVITEDLSTKNYYKLFSSCHVCLAPSRWEGLGLHLYEATAFGIPIITNDIPPMNEIVQDRYNGLLVKSYSIGCTKSGLGSYEPDVEALSRAIRDISDHGIIEELSRNTRKLVQVLSWDKTVSHFIKLLQL